MGSSTIERTVDGIGDTLHAGKKTTRRSLGAVVGIAVAKPVEYAAATVLHVATPTFLSYKNETLKHLPEDSKVRKTARGLRTTANTIEATGAGVMAMTIFIGPAALAVGGSLYLAGRVPGLFSEAMARGSQRLHRRRTT